VNAKTKFFVCFSTHWHVKVGKYSNKTQKGRGHFFVLPHKNAIYSTAQRKLILKNWAGRQNYNLSQPVFCLRAKEQGSPGGKKSWSWLF